MSNSKTNKRGSVTINLRIDFMYNSATGLTLNQLKQTAIGLALNPNYHTIESGVQLTSTDYVEQITSKDHTINND